MPVSPDHCSSISACASSSLDAKWKYSAPLVTPALVRISERLAPLNPRSSKTSAAASRIALRVRSARSCRAKVGTSSTTRAHYDQPSACHVVLIICCSTPPDSRRPRVLHSVAQKYCFEPSKKNRVVGMVPPVAHTTQQTGYRFPA